MFKSAPPSQTVYDEESKRFVKSYKSVSNKGKTCEKKYWKVMLYDEDGIQRGVYLHVIKAKTYIPNPENKQFIDHIDNDTLNNDITNLRWATRSKNCQNKLVRRDSKSGIKNIRFRKNGTFEVIVIDDDGIRHDKTLKTLQEAITLAKYWRKQYHKEFAHD